MSEAKIVGTDLLFPEGPVAMSDGSVLVAEIRRGTVTRVHPDGTKTIVANCGGGPNGMAIGPDGALYVCNNGGNVYPENHFAATGPAKDWAGGSIQRVDLATGEVKTLYTHCGDLRLSAPNDIVFDKHGGMYFSDFGKKHAHNRDHGGLFYALPDGSSITKLAYPVAAPNGVGLSPDGKVLYVAETETATVWAFDILEPGKLARHPWPSPHGGRLVCGLPGYQRLDSLAIDSAGNICIGTLILGVVTVIAPTGEVLDRVKLPGNYVTNICFGGPDLKTAYTTLSDIGQLAAIEWPRPGLKLEYNA
jgi:gluconolactonase